MKTKLSSCNPYTKYLLQKIDHTRQCGLVKFMEVTRFGMAIVSERELGVRLGLQWFENFFKSLRQLHHSQIYRGLSFRGKGEGKIYVEIFNSTNPKKLNEYEKNSKNFIYRNLKQMQKEDQNFSCKLKFLPNRETHKETVDSFNKTSRCHISRI